MQILEPDTPLSTYRIVRPIGHGGSIVYQAFDIHLERDVAIKVLYPGTRVDSAYVERFKREGTTHSKLRHPNIVRVFAADESEHGLWIAMELMAGGTLRTKLRGEPLDPLETLDLLSPIAAALDYAHGRGSIHRDVKPENILLDEDGVPHLSDFGIVKNLGEPALTKTGRGLGTAGYASPEQIKGLSVAPQSDVYSLGVVLFECLVGDELFPPATEERMRRRKQSLPRARDRNPALPAAIEPVLRKALSEAPGDRHESATALMAAAREALLTPDPAAPTIADAWQSKRPPRFRRLILGGLAGCLFLLLGLGAGVVTGGSAGPRPALAAAAGGVEIEGPPGWRQAAGGEAVLGLGVAERIVLESPEGDPGAGSEVTAGVSAASGRSLLPNAYANQRAANVQRPAGRSLGGLQAYRYIDLSEPGSRRPVTLFVSPTTLGVATVACRFSSRADESEARLCERIAGTLRLEEGRGYRLGPSTGFGRALRKRLSRLIPRRDKARSRLASADDGPTQALAAEELADAYERAASGLGRLEVSPQSRRARGALANALWAARGAYASLAVGARGEDADRYSIAAEAAKFAEKSFARNLRALAALGYAIKGGAKTG